MAELVLYDEPAQRQELQEIFEIDLTGKESTCYAVLDKYSIPIACLTFFHYGLGSIEMAVYSTTPKWLAKNVIQQTFDYTFYVCEGNRVEAIIAKSNTHTQKFVERIGFTKEGVLRQKFDGEDAVVYSFLKEEWETSKYNARSK